MAADGPPDEQVSRRSFLGAAGAAGALAGPGGLHEAVRRRPSQTAAPAGHDHAGETLRPGDLASARTPVVNVSAHGVVGDGETDDSAAFQAAADAATPRGVLYVPPDVDLYFETPVDVDLGGNAPDHVPFALVCDGTLRPAAGIGDAVTIHDGGSVYVDFRVAGGGADGDVAVAVTRSHWSHYEGVAAGYGGTALDLRWGAEPGQSWSIGTLQGVDCGQTLRVSECGGVGQVGKLIEVGPRRMATFANPVDMSIGTYRGAADADTEEGLTLQSPLSLWVDSLQVEGTPAIDNVTLAEPRYVHLGHVETSGGDRGLVVDGGEVFNVDSVEAADNRVGVDYSVTHRTNLEVDAHDNEEAGLVVRSASGPGNWIRGSVSDNGAPARVASAGGVLTLADLTVVGNDGPEPTADATGDPEADAVQLEVSTPEFGVSGVRLYDARVPAIDGDPLAVDDAATVDDLAALQFNEFRTGPPKWTPGDTVEVAGEGVYLRGHGDRWWRID
jgi:hypothetical protein